MHYTYVFKHFSRAVTVKKVEFYSTSKTKCSNMGVNVMEHKKSTCTSPPMMLKHRALVPSDRVWTKSPLCLACIALRKKKTKCVLLYT